MHSDLWRGDALSAAITLHLRDRAPRRGILGGSPHRLACENLVQTERAVSLVQQAVLTRP
jgi:hypothetical protein